MALAQRLADDGSEVMAYDPKAIGPARAQLRGEISFTATADACVAMSEVIVVMTPWSEFKSIGADVFARPERRMTVIDCWRILPDDIAAVADVVHLGRAAAASLVATA